MLDLDTDYLICSFGQVSATGLSRLLCDEISHDTVTRFLAAEPKTSAHLWRVVKGLVRAVEREDGVLIIGDSIEEKPSTDENELVSWHYDHSQERTIKGINFLTALYHASDVSLPVAFDMVTKTQAYFDPQTSKTKRKSALTKNERYPTLLRVAVHNEVKFRSRPQRRVVCFVSEHEVHQTQPAQRVRHARPQITAKSHSLSPLKNVVTTRQSVCLPSPQRRPTTCGSQRWTFRSL